MKMKVKDGYLLIRIPLESIPGWGEDEDGWEDEPAPKKPKKPKAPRQVEHTEACVKLRAAELIFSRQWPMHCRTCAAKGWILNNQTGQKISCPRCLEFGLCARCGNSALQKRSDEDGTYYACPDPDAGCGWSQRDAFSTAAEAAGIIAPVWRCTCEKENQDEAV